MINMSEINAVIFDMDGLVLDSEPTYVNAWSRTLDAMGYPDSRSICEGWVGLSYSAITEELLSVFGTEFDLDRFGRMGGEFWRTTAGLEGIPVRPGLHSLLDLITEQNLPYCLATNSIGVKARECLRYGGVLELFPLIFSRDQVTLGKPDPELFIKAAQTLNIPISKCLVLEDSYPGVLGAVRAGAVVGYIPSHGLDANADRLATCRLADLHAVAELLKVRRR